MEALAVASSVMAVVELSAKVASLCLQYFKEAKNARETINKLRSQVEDLTVASESLYQLLNGPHGSSLKVSQELQGAINDCILQLERLYEALRPIPSRQALSRLRLRSLAWPFSSKDVERTVGYLQRYTQTISLALQIDTTNILLNMDQAKVLDQLHIAEGAAFDSYAQEHNSFCLPNTRVELLQQIKNWAQDISTKPIFWLNGMAGTGKSTISRTLARSLAEKGQLGASFFFKRGEADRGSLHKFFMTIAADLVVRMPSVAPYIKDALIADRSITTKNASEQFTKLLLTPLLKTAIKDKPITIIIDALDECECDDDIRLILRLFSRFNATLPQQIRIFLTSRPELTIRCGFEEIQGKYQNAILHEMPQPLLRRDISTVLAYKLEMIREDYNHSVLTDQYRALDWPGQFNFDALVSMATPLFVVAATICLFIGDRKVATPSKQLEKILSRSGDGLSKLERTYRSVLDNLIEGVAARQQEQILDEFRTVVGSIILLASPLSTSELAKLLSMTRDDVDNRLALLHSVLHIPSSPEMPVRLFHLSFRDFLLDPVEPTMPFRIDMRKTHTDLAANCLRVLLGCLKQDICDIRAPGTLRSTITAERIRTRLPPVVQYACIYWVYHLEKTEFHVCNARDVHIFLARHFLHWLEGLALIGRASEIPGLLSMLQSRLKGQKSVELSIFLEDAIRFTRAYLLAIDTTPLQIYSSLLIFTPKSSMVRNTFRDKALWISSQPQVEDHWGQCLQTFEGHSDWVTSLAFSHDSKLIVSASFDKTVRIWRVNTGDCTQTLQGHGSRVTSVAFSHNSELVASASEDSTVRIWHTHTGECVQTLEGHSDWVTSVAFSHDGEFIASASNDKTVRLWPNDRGTFTRTLQGHSDHVTSVAISHNSKLLASSSKDSTVRIWNANTGECIQTLQGHNDWVTSVVFSHNSALLATATGRGIGVVSYDTTVRIWRADTGKCLKTLQGHSMSVMSVAFSHDSALVVSASIDNLVRIWRTSTGECEQILRGHNSRVTSVAFSHNSDLVGSASADMTIRTWHVDISRCVQKRQGHTSRVRAVTISHDSTLVASASADRTVRIWQADTGECLQTLSAHSDWVQSVVFSYNSTLVASASSDKTVRIWRTNSGECLQTLYGHEGHGFSVVFSHSALLVACGSAETVWIWRVNTGECTQTLQGHSDSVWSVVFSHDSTLVASSSADMTVRIWRTDTGRCVQTLQGHTAVIRRVAFSHDSAFIASASDDKTVRVWSVDTGECKQILHTGPISLRLLFNRNGSHILTDLGELAINCIGSDSTSLSENAKPMKYSGFGISQDGCWVTRNGENLLWLPAEFRPDALALSGNTIVTGSGSGKVAILKLAHDYTDVNHQLPWY